MNDTPAIQSEKALLGALFLDDTLFDSIKDIVSADDFFSDSHQLIFRSIKDVYDDKHRFDIAGVSLYGNIDEGYLCYLADECCSTANIVSHAHVIKEYSVQRNLREIALEVNEGKDNVDK